MPQIPPIFFPFYFGYSCFYNIAETQRTHLSLSHSDFSGEDESGYERFQSDGAVSPLFYAIEHSSVIPDGCGNHSL